MDASQFRHELVLIGFELFKLGLHFVLNLCQLLRHLLALSHQLFAPFLAPDLIPNRRYRLLIDRDGVLVFRLLVTGVLIRLEKRLSRRELLQAWRSNQLNC